MEPTTRAPRRRSLAIAVALAALSALVLAGCWSENQGKALDLVNSSRSANQRASLAGNVAVMDKAQAWSDRMAQTGRVEHTGGGSRLDTSGIPKWCAVAENVGVGPSTEAVHHAFMNSSVHRSNLLGNFTHVGTGVTRSGDRVYVTQIFFRSC